MTCDLMQSADGSTLNVDCSTFSLGRGEDLVVSEKDGSTEVDRNRWVILNDEYCLDLTTVAIYNLMLDIIIEFDIIVKRLIRLV